MSNADREPTLAEQIEACDLAAQVVEPRRNRFERVQYSRLTSAARTLRRVQRCRQLAEEQCSTGVIVAADIEGLIA